MGICLRSQGVLTRCFGVGTFAHLAVMLIAPPLVCEPLAAEIEPAPFNKWDAGRVVMVLGQKSKYRKLLEADKNLLRWYTEGSQRSTQGAVTDLTTLGLFLTRHHITPAELITHGQEKIEGLLEDFVKGWESEGKAPTYIKSVRRAVISWASWNGIFITRRIKVRNTGDRPALRGKTVPSPEDLRRVLEIAAARERVALALMAFGGVRLQTIASFDGTDGLVIGDVQDAHLDDAGIVFDEMPTRINIPVRLDPSRRGYFTFIGSQACDYVTAYLRLRSSQEEHLDSNSPLVAACRYPSGLERGGDAFLSSHLLSGYLRRIMHRAGLDSHPSICRNYFASRALLAEPKGFLREWKHFVMGRLTHIGRIHSQGAGLPPEAVQKMRMAYQGALTFLETESRVPGPDIVGALMASILEAVGRKQEEIETLSLSGKSNDELLQILASLRPRLSWG